MQSMKWVSAMLASFWMCAAHAGLFTIPGEYSVSNMGAATYSVPIELPPSAGGMSPTLAISYSSHGGKGILGPGFSLLGMSAITRCAKTIAQDAVPFNQSVSLTYDDRYCLDGQRLILVSGASYGADGAEYRTELDGFSKIVSYGQQGNGASWFKVWTKAGKVIEYGNTVDSKVLAQGVQTALIWAQNRVQDIKGNYWVWTYGGDRSVTEWYPLSLIYSLPASDAIKTGVVFSYIPSADNQIGFVGGSKVQTKSVVSKMEVWSGGSVARSYSLSYHASPITGVPRLEELTLCGPNNQCSLPTGFAYQNNGEANFSSFPQKSTRRLKVDRFEHYFADVNGDGIADWIQLNRFVDDGWVGLGNSSGTFQHWTDVILDIGADNDFAHYFVDMNGDGKADAIKIARATKSIQVSLSGEYGHFGPWTTVTNQNDSASTSEHFFADVNGDGIPDWIQVSKTSDIMSVIRGQRSGIFFDYSQRIVSAGAAMNNYANYFIDVNGDGRADWISISKTLNQTRVSLSNGDGTFTLKNVSVRGTANANQHFFVDINGDGIPDIIRVSQATASADIGLGLGDGRFELWSSSTSEIGSGQTWANYFVDVNGDGKADWIQVQAGASNSRIALSRGDGTFTFWTVTSTERPGLNEYQNYFADANGDGLLDWIQVARTIGMGTVALNVEYHDRDKLIAIDQGFQDKIIFDYAILADPAIYTKGANTVYPMLDVQPPISVVRHSAHLDNASGGETHSYTYGGLRAEQQSGRGVLGFEWIAKKDDRRNTVTRTDFRQDFPFIGLPGRVRVTLVGSGNDSLLKETINTYACTNFMTSGCASTLGQRYFVWPTNTVESKWDLNGAAFPVDSSDMTFDCGVTPNSCYGNATQRIVRKGQSWVKTTDTEYLQPDLEKWIIGKVKKSTVTTTGLAP